MTLTQEQKTYLSDNINSVLVSFDAYKHSFPFMAVYFTDQHKPYITFGNSNVFNSTIIMGKRRVNLACVYDTTLDFNTQSNSFLA